MGEENQSYHHGALRAALLAAAPELIVETGIHGFTLRALARRVGVTHTAAYRHFASKRDLLAALALDGHQRFAAALAETGATAQTLPEALLCISKAYLRWALENPGVYQAMFGPRLNEDGAHPELERAIADSFAAVEAVCARLGVEGDQVRDLSVALLTQLHGYVDLYRLRRIRVDGPAGAQSYLEALLAPLIAGAQAATDN